MVVMVVPVVAVLMAVVGKTERVVQVILPQRLLRVVTVRLRLLGKVAMEVMHFLAQVEEIVAVAGVHLMLGVQPHRRVVEMAETVLLLAFLGHQLLTLAVVVGLHLLVVLLDQVEPEVVGQDRNQAPELLGLLVPAAEAEEEVTRLLILLQAAQAAQASSS
jgi:hypothetical protein